MVRIDCKRTAEDQNMPQEEKAAELICRSYETLLKRVERLQEPCKRTGPTQRRSKRWPISYGNG